MRGKAAIEPIRWQTDKDGPLTEAALKRKIECLGYSVTRYVYQAGVYFPDHSHGVDKMDGVISGRFRMVVGGQEIVLEAGDMLAVPAGVVHSAEVVGDGPVVSLDGVRV